RLRRVARGNCGFRARADRWRESQSGANLLTALAMTIFEKIARGEIPAKIVHEDDEFIAFHDSNPQAPVHVLIVPKRVIPRIGEAVESDATLLGRMLIASQEIARHLGVFESGYRLVINHGPDAGESVPHLHIHLLGQRKLAWPPG